MREQTALRTRTVGIAAACLLLALSAGLAGCSDSGKAAQTNQAAAGAAQTKAVKIEPVAKHMIASPYEQVADVLAASQIDIVAKAGGEVKQVLKKRGDSVQAGETLALLDNADALSQKQKSEINVASLEAQLKKTQEDTASSRLDLQNQVEKLQKLVSDDERAYNRLRNDYDTGAASKTQVEQAETAYTNAKLDLAGAQRKLDALNASDPLASLNSQLETARVGLADAERALDNYELKSPIAGVLTDWTPEAGMSIAGGYKAGQVQQLDKLKIHAELTESAAQLVRGKKTLEFYIPGSTQTKKATVSYMADVMSASTKSYPLDLETDNAGGGLKPGTRVQLKLTEEAEQNVVAVPTLSIVREGSDNFVYVFVTDHVEKRKIELGRLNDTMQEVLSGVKEGEQLVVSGQHQLQDKEKVTAAPAAAAKTAAPNTDVAKQGTAK